VKARLLILSACVAILAGCTGPRPSAPVIDRLPSGTAPKPPAVKPVAVAPAQTRAADRQEDTYTVKAGDTLYSISLDHGQDYREVAQWNNIDNPNLIRIGQVLRVKPPREATPAAGVQVKPVASAGSLESRPLGASGAQQSPAATASKPPAASAGAPSLLKTEPRAVKLPYSEENLALLSRDPKPAAPPTSAAAVPAKPAAETKPSAEAAGPPAADGDAIDWGWPTTGRVSGGFNETTNKGIDIAGKQGQPVLASASGTVSYVGSGIRGYGKFVVVRHNKEYLSVYAHNDNILVKEGQRVVKGQKIAEMGNTDSDQVKLHFEIRRQGKPVDPGKYLPER
jgi:lipoprotein NlpD